ncbi:MAG TPA: hypothetical protein VGG36_12285 [Rhizomicrobium sp.]|jgi:hypothetical protein
MIGSERSQPVLLPTAEPFPEDATAIKVPVRRHPATGVLIFALILGAFWMGAAAAYLWGYFGPRGLTGLDVQEMAVLGFATFVPPMLIVACAWALTRGMAMTATAAALAEAAEKLFAADETAARTAARLGRAVRRELDALNAGLDGAFARLRALEGVLENNIAALDEAGARADVRADSVAARLAQERERIDQIACSLTDTAARASEIVAGRVAQLKATIETAEGSLKQAGTQLDAQAASFRAAADSAAEAPFKVAVELDKQAKAIEAVADATVARAEFVLGRHERHRGSMNELLQRLADETATFESALAAQRSSLDEAARAIHAEAKKFETTVGDTDRQLDSTIANASARTTQLAQSFHREAEKMKEVSESATATLSRLVDSLRDAGVGAQTLIGETANEAKKNAKALVGEAMGECERLLRTAGELSAQAIDIRSTLSGAVAEVEKHLLTLPSLAQQEAARVRDTVRSETEQMLDLSARTISTMHARNAARNGLRAAQPGEPEPEPQPNEGLIGMARRLTQRAPKLKSLPQKQPPADIPDGKNWNMRTLLAAVEIEEDNDRNLKPGAAAALGALQTALADIAVDLDAIVGGDISGEEEWKQYLSGDRSIFARKLADSISTDTVERVCTYYRENIAFHDAANIYLAEFESLMARAQDGDGDGLLTSSLLGADTGKIYLAVAYALGRLS